MRFINSFAPSMSKTYSKQVSAHNRRDKNPPKRPSQNPDFYIGIECKAHADPTSLMITNRLQGMAGNRMKEHVKKYTKIGIEHIFLVTNLPENHAQKLENALKASIEKQNIKVKTLRVIPGKIDTLLQFLNKLANTITKKTTSFIEGNKPEIDSYYEAAP